MALNSQLTHSKFKVWMKRDVNITNFHFNLFGSKSGDYADDKIVLALYKNFYLLCFHPFSLFLFFYFSFLSHSFISMICFFVVPENCRSHYLQFMKQTIIKNKAKLIYNSPVYVDNLHRVTKSRIF